MTSNDSQRPFPATETRRSESGYAGRMNNSKGFRALTGAGLLALVITFTLTPAFYEARAFSLSDSIASLLAPTADASSTRAPAPAYNSQTIPLLAPATNRNPNPAQGGGDITVVGGTALAAQSGPSGTAADIEEWPTASQISVYIVRDGDTLSDIAHIFNVSVNTILWANDIKNGAIHPGDSLIILPVAGVRHIVSRGETLNAIANTFKADAGDIAQYNGIDPHQSLAVGASIIIPNGEMPAVQPKKTIFGSIPSLFRAGSPHKITTAPYEPLHDAGGPDYGTYYQWPVSGGYVSQGLHGWNAVDIAADIGTPIYAAADGLVIAARTGGWNGGYGSYVVISHKNGTQTLYGHCSKVLVSAGQHVSQGQTIALIGETGLATGPHTHFEVRGAKNPFGSVAVGDGE